jgi:hypothetical protein
MTRPRIVALTLIASVIAMAMATVSAQTPPPPPSRVMPPLSQTKAEYYRQHPQEFEQLVDRLSSAPRQIPPGKILAPDEAPVSGTWTSLTNNSTGVGFSNPQLLTDGTVLLYATCSGAWYKLTPNIAGSYINGTISQVASLPSGYAPRFFGGGVLPDGRYIIEGGEYNGCSAVNTNQGAVYDPVANTWTAVNPPAGWTQIGDAAGVVLDNGTYMQSNCCDQPAKAALLNPANLTWTPTGTGKFDVFDEEGLTKLPTGKILTVDAYVFTGACGKNTELYNPATGAWTAAGSTIDQQVDCLNNATQGNNSGELGPLVVRPNGTAVSFPGVTGSTPAVADIYTVSSGTWATGFTIPSVGGVPYTLADAPAAVLPNGNILFAASPSDWAANGSFPATTHFFEVDLNGVITQVADTADSATHNAFEQNLLVLPTGQVLAVGTDDTNAQIYTPSGTAQAAWQPVITSVPSCVAAGGTYVASGTQLNGRSEGSYYGDDANASVNFPTIKIVNNSTGHVFYARTFNHSTRSIAAGVSVTTSFKVASATETGASTLYDVGAGIPSAGTPITVSSGCLNAAHDFNGDGKSDILLRDTNTGAVKLWLMNGGVVFPGGTIAGIATNWQIVAQRDFNGDGNADILWRDNTTGTVRLFLMNGLTVTQNLLVASNVPSNFVIAGVGDFNGDGKADILWRNMSTGAVSMWFMNGATVLNTGIVGTVTLTWSIIGTSPNGHILWRNNSTGALTDWVMNGAAVSQTHNLGTVNAPWAVIGSGDFDGNGSRDLLLRNGSTGEVKIWFTTNGVVSSVASLGIVPAAYSADLTGDFNGDGKSDIVWTNNSTGARSIWFMNGGVLASSTNLGTVATTLQIQSKNAE